MLNMLRELIKKTPPYQSYLRFKSLAREQKIREEFWKWSDTDQKYFNFYEQFISENDIVFDVGANLGNRTKIFSRLGATVVAVEPQAKCADFLSSVFKKTKDFYLVRKALGSYVGSAEMFVCNTHTISSLSQDWIQSVRESGRFAEYEWERKEVVPIETLDNLITEYGEPSFVKIDVEGFEDKVVAGLSKPVKSLSMEYCPEFIKSTLKCIEHLDQISVWEYQLSIGESMEFALPSWVDSMEIRKELLNFKSNRFGDLYARLNCPADDQAIVS